MYNCYIKIKVLKNKKEKSDRGVIIRENSLKVSDISESDFLLNNNEKVKPENMIFFDLEHYVYKKPKCIGVFGACVYNKNNYILQVTQYMIENKDEGQEILYLAQKYFKNMKASGKDTIVTFSGNNDFTVINYLFEKYGIEYDFKKEYKSIDIQKEYEHECKRSIGLKKLEKGFGIERESEVISGSNLAKTFHKVMKDKDYLTRMPKEKLEKILLYNEQDVVNLFYIITNWFKHINELKEIEAKNIQEEKLKKEKSLNENIRDVKSIEEIENEVN